LADAMMKLAFSKTRLLRGQSKRADKLRQKIADAIPGQLEHFVSTGLEFGYAYGAGLVVPEASPQPKIGAGVVDYRPTTWPGARLPHSLVEHEGRTRPLIDLLDKRRLTLLVHDADAWRQALRQVPDVLMQHLHIVQVSPCAGAELQTLVQQLQVGQQGAILVRPDAHVAWRSSQAATASMASLESALARLTDCFLANTCTDAGESQQRMLRNVG
jgi:hypothetical protein